MRHFLHLSAIAVHVSYLSRNNTITAQVQQSESAMTKGRCTLKPSSQRQSAKQRLSIWRDSQSGLNPSTQGLQRRPRALHQLFHLLPFRLAVAVVVSSPTSSSGIQLAVTPARVTFGTSLLSDGVVLPNVIHRARTQ